MICVMFFCSFVCMAILVVIFFLMIQRPPISTRTDTLFPYTTLFRSAVHVINSSQKISYKQFPGGNYSVRVIYDDNANQVWDTGNLAEKRQPEQLWYWNKIVTIRPNWEQERSDERSVGKECGSTGRSRGSLYN